MDFRAEEWLSRYRGGDAEALGRLVEEYRRPLYAFISRMLEGHADADEVFQDVWFRAIRSLDSFRAGSFLSWLFRIAHNLVIDRVRRGRPVVDLHATPGESEGDPLDTRFAARGLAPDDQVAGRDLGARIHEAARKLPAEQYEVFVMRTDADIPFREIARIQGTSINTALARMHYAVKKLRAELSAEYGDLSRTRR
jgi:RNA polymerase sigma-70 factor (ECF subfamily)